MYENFCEAFCQYISLSFPYILGYAFSIFAAFFFLNLVMDTIWSGIESKDWNDKQEEDLKTEIYKKPAKMVGLLDRILFTTALVAGYESFIAVWLAFKIAGRWENGRFGNEILINKIKEMGNTSKGIEMDKFKIKDNMIYNTFTIGNALSLIYAVTGWKIIEWVKIGSINSILKAIIIPAIVIIGTLLFKKIFIEDYKNKYIKIFKSND